MPGTTVPLIDYLEDLEIAAIDLEIAGTSSHNCYSIYKQMPNILEALTPYGRRLELERVSVDMTHQGQPYGLRQEITGGTNRAPRDLDKPLQQILSGRKRVKSLVLNITACNKYDVCALYPCRASMARSLVPVNDYSELSLIQVKLFYPGGAYGRPMALTSFK